MDYDTYFREHLEALHQEGRYRVFAELKRRCGAYPAADQFTGKGTRDVTVWCSNDYLGMSQHPAVRAAMHEAIETVGAGSGGTRNISGTTHYHVELEAELADLHGKEAALLFTSAYIANDATLSTLQRLIPGLVIFSDEKNHASMIQGIVHGGGEKHIFRHNDVEHLEEKLKKYPLGTPKIIVFESVYSMDGHIAPIAAICRSRREIQRADLSRRGPRCRPLRPARRRHRRARRRDAPHRHHQRHARQGLRRHGRLYRREQGLLRRHPLLCAGLHLHHLARACHRRRRARQHQAFEDQQFRARAHAGARADVEKSAHRRRPAGDGQSEPHRSGDGRRSRALQGGDRHAARALRNLRAADQLSDGAARHRAHAAHAIAGAYRRADGGADRRTCRSSGRAARWPTASTSASPRSNPLPLSGDMHGEPDRRRLGPRPGHAMPAMGGEKDPVACDELAVGCLTFDA